jgi:hypothetical protein
MTLISWIFALIRTQLLIFILLHLSIKGRALLLSVYRQVRLMVSASDVITTSNLRTITLESLQTNVFPFVFIYLSQRETAGPEAGPRACSSNRSGTSLFPERLTRSRSICLSFEVFNAIQSKCFEAVYKTNDNLVLSAPTGSGKLQVLEMAVCRLMENFKTDQYKIVYQAPTKSLCSERHRDWQAKLLH